MKDKYSNAIDKNHGQIYLNLKMKITIPTVKTTHAPTIPPTVTGILFDDL